MDVAGINKNYVDPASGGKSGSAADQMMADFSAAVAARMSSAGGKAGEQGKNNLVSSLGTKTAEPKPQVEASQPAPRDDLNDTRSPQRSNDDYVDNAPAERPRDDRAPANEHRAQDDAPRDDAPRDDHASTASTETRSDDTASTHEAPTEAASADNANAADAPAQEATATESAVDPATAAAAAGAAQAPVVGQAEKVLAANVTKAEASVGATGDGSQKHNALNGLNTAQDSAAKNNANPGDTQKGNDGQGDVKADSGKAKAAAAQGQQGPAKAEAGPTTAQQQASELSRTVGQDQRVNVSVNVTKQSNELTSQPSQALSAQAATEGADDAATTGLLQASTKGQGKNLAAGQKGSDGQPQNQSQGQSQGQAQNQVQGQTPGMQQAQLQAAQAEAAKAATGGDAKAQAAQANTAAQATAKVGGGEGMASTQATAPSAATSQTHQAAAPAKPQATPQAQARAQVTEQVTVQISKAIADGMDTIRIQLKPAHLGRVDVQLEMGQDGRVTAVISADNKATLDLLKQDSRELQQALRDAGMQMDSSDLSFNLRGQGGEATGEQETAQGGSGKAAADPLHEPTLEELLEAQTGHKNIITEDRVDITA